MRGTFIPFAETADVTATPGAYKIPQAGTNGSIDPAWIGFPTPPTGASRLYGIIVEVGETVPSLASNVKALAYDKNSNQVLQWDGSKWRTIAG